MKPTRIALAALALVAAACASENKDDHQRPEIRAALDESQYTFRDALPLAVAASSAGEPFEGALVLGDDPVFAVGIDESTSLKEIRINGVSGAVEGNTPVGGALPCTDPGQIPLDQALDIAEAEAGGEAIASVPDDDVACAFEIQVMVDVTLWEVKVGPDGAVLEHELSDEYGGSED